MSDPVTKAVKAVTLLNQSISNPKHFSKVAVAVIAASGLIGCGLMQIVDQKREVSLQWTF